MLYRMVYGFLRVSRYCRLELYKAVRPVLCPTKNRYQVSWDETRKSTLISRLTASATVRTCDVKWLHEHQI